MKKIAAVMMGLFPLGFWLSTSGLAGEAPAPALGGGKAPASLAEVQPGGEPFAGLSVEAGAGWDSHYIFRGELLQENTFWTQLSFDLPLTEAVSLNLTPWFLQDGDTDYNELDLSAALTYSLDPWSFSAGYAGYYYPRKSLGGNEGIGDEQELTSSVSRRFGDFTTTLLGAYSLTRDGFYYELSLAYDLALAEKLTLTPTVALGADTDYFATGTDLNHVSLRLAASYELTPNCTFSPYIAGNLPTGHLESDVGQDFYGGISLTLGF